MACGLAGIPVEVRMMESSVGENSRLDEAFADSNLASTRRGSESVRPRIIFRDIGWRNGERAVGTWQK